MQFKKGQVVVHPQHGPATVKAVANRVVQGQRRRYLTLTVHADGMSVALPADAAEEVGVRPVMDSAAVKRVFGVLVDDGEPFDKVWSRRFKNNTERLRSGDMLRVAGLIRDVTRRNDETRVSYGEAGLLEEAMDLLTAELAISLHVSAEQAADLVLAAVRERTMPNLAHPELPLAG